MVQDFPCVEITDKLNSQICFAQWLCRLPHHPWTPLACSTPGKSPLDEVPAMGELLDFNWSSSPFPATCETSDDLQEEERDSRKRSREACPEITPDSLDESKGKFLGSYAIDDNIIPERRPMAYDLDRTKTPRRLRHPAAYENSDHLQEEGRDSRKRSRETCPEVTLDSLDESKSKFLGSYAIDDSIIPERRPRAYDLDRTKTPRRLRHP